MPGPTASPPTDSYAYGPEEIAEFERRFELAPVPPSSIREHLDDGTVLVTTDIPDYLDRGIANQTDEGLALYRLIQLFGTPNVPGLEAGADQPDRNRTTWQFLFRLTDAEPASGAGSEEYLLSVYDHRTTLSVGFSGWYPVDDDRLPDDAGDPTSRAALEPTGDALPGATMPPESLSVKAVQLILGTVNHAVKATYRDLHV